MTSAASSSQSSDIWVRVLLFVSIKFSFLKSPKSIFTDLFLSCLKICSLILYITQTYRIKNLTTRSPGNYKTKFKRQPQKFLINDSDTTLF